MQKLLKIIDNFINDYLNFKFPILNFNLIFIDPFDSNDFFIYNYLYNELSYFYITKIVKNKSNKKL